MLSAFRPSDYSVLERVFALQQTRQLTIYRVLPHDNFDRPTHPIADGPTISRTLDQ